jgi:hypothetical protein
VFTIYGGCGYHVDKFNNYLTLKACLYGKDSLSLLCKERDMIKNYKNYQCELSGSVVYIRKNDELIKAVEVNVWEAVERYQSLCKQVEKLSLG